MAEVKLITQAEYAKRRGCSAVAVHKAVKAGRISLIGDKIDPTVADIQWKANTRARTQNVKDGATEPNQASADDLVSQAAKTSPTPDAAPPAAAAPPPAVPDGYNAARARREIADAETAEIGLMKLRGEVLMRVDVDRAGFEIGREIRDAMEATVNALAAELAPLMSAEACAEVLRRHNRAIQDLLVKSFREKIGAAPQRAAA